MEKMRLNYGRAQRGGLIYHPSYGRWSKPRRHPVYDPQIGRTRWEHERPGPMPIDLKAYVIALQYDADKHRFPKIIAELVKQKAEIHPFARRFLMERMRASENKHRELAERFGAVADQFEIEEEDSKGATTP
jgi:hypothetical protein